ncbi:hypothetical protein AVEN_260944-1 [Araneus ventricosus]|uniref:Uncharacterized protein n=1 Tax=Araneus ventricosus TaxID=182803 RepID=A0A4Y2KHY0_ARAVE|nr:hypothetical protein AVEN_260944-1 [Araneus ventricosus]
MLFNVSQCYGSSFIVGDVRALPRHPGYYISNVAGYCCYSYAKSKKCQSCKDSISVNDKFEIPDDVEDSYIQALDRGCLAYPKPGVLQIIIYSYVVVQQLISEKYEHMFLKMQKLKALKVRKIGNFQAESAGTRNSDSNSATIFFRGAHYFSDHDHDPRPPIRPLGLDIWTYFDIVHIKPYTRLGSYAAGIALGCYMHKQKLSNFKKFNLVKLSLGWIISSFLLWLCTFGVIDPQGSAYEIAAFHSIKPLLYGCFFSWVTFACFTGQGACFNPANMPLVMDLSCVVLHPNSK